MEKTFKQCATCSVSQCLYLVVRETCSREDGDLLASGDAVHAVDGRDAGLDHLLGVNAALGVDGLTCRRGRKMSPDRQRMKVAFKKSGDAAPMMSRKSSARTAGPLSMGFPEPLNTRPARKKKTC